MLKRQSSTHITNPSLEELEKILFESDAIMRPDIFDQLSEYIQKGGNIEKISRILMQHYRGIPNMINIISNILKDVVHVDSDEIIKQQVRNSMLELFKIDKMDDLLLSKKKIPKEFKIMFQNPFWIDTILTLSQKSDYSQSLFIAYCVNKICKSHPEKITSLPPFYISYSSYLNVLQHILSQIKERHDPSLVEILIKIVSTDDLTLTHAALAFHGLSQEALGKLRDKLKESKKKDLFNKITFSMDPSCDMQLSDLIIGQANLRISDLQRISKLDNISFQMKTLLIQKISEVLKDNNNTDKTLTAAIDCLIKVTEQNINDDDHEFIFRAFENVHQSSYLIEDMSEILYAVKFPYFNDILKEIAINQLSSHFEKVNDTGLSPQSQIICEYAYQYRTKISGLAVSLMKAFKKNESNESLFKEFFYIFTYIVKLGYSKDILKQYSEMIYSEIKQRNSKLIRADLHREFIKSLINLKFPNKTQSPSVCHFIEAMTILFDNPNILNLILPESSVNMLSMYKRYISQLRDFLDRIPHPIDISDEAMEILNAVRDRLSSLS